MEATEADKAKAREVLYGKDGYEPPTTEQVALALAQARAEEREAWLEALRNEAHEYRLKGLEAEAIAFERYADARAIRARGGKT